MQHDHITKFNDLSKQFVAELEKVLETASAQVDELSRLRSVLSHMGANDALGEVAQKFAPKKKEGEKPDPKFLAAE